MRAFDDGRVACPVMPGSCGAGDAMPTPLAKIVFIVSGYDEYTAAGRVRLRGGSGCVVLPVLLACPRVVGVLLVVEERLDCSLSECAFAPGGYLPL